MCVDSKNATIKRCYNLKSSFRSGENFKTYEGSYAKTIRAPTPRKKIKINLKAKADSEAAEEIYANLSDTSNSVFITGSNASSINIVINRPDQNL